MWPSLFLSRWEHWNFVTTFTISTSQSSTSHFLMLPLWPVASLINSTPVRWVDYLGKGEVLSNITILIHLCTKCESRLLYAQKKVFNGPKYRKAWRWLSVARNISVRSLRLIDCVSRFTCLHAASPSASAGRIISSRRAERSSSASPLQLQLHVCEDIFSMLST